MLTRPLSIIIAALSFSLIGACTGTGFEPAPAQSEPVDLLDYAPRVDTFVVLLDTSGSMQDDDPEQAKFQTAQDMVANFNNAVPEAGFNAGLVIFGKGAGSCMGDGVARTIYGMETYRTADFLAALGSIECVRSTTPIVPAIDLADDMLTDDSGDIAVVVFSDLKWAQPDAVLEAMGRLRSNHSGRLCVHTVRIGDYSSNNELIAQIHDGNACDSNVNAADIDNPAAMTSYVADILMAPVDYESYTISAMTLFDFDKSELKEAGKAELRHLGESIKARGIRVRDIDIIGHTDSVGTQVYNAGLSERRAAAVEAFLIELGIDPAILGASGMGELDPVASNRNASGRALNRRVEILVGAARRDGT